MTKEYGFTAIWGDDSNTNPKILEVFICKLRRKLGYLGIKIKCHWGIGYSISPEDKAKVRQALALNR